MRVSARGTSGIGAAVLLALGCLWPLPAASQHPMTLFQQRMARYRAGNCSEALPLFEEAYRLRPAPALLKKIADCRERAGDLAGARAALSTYLANPNLETDAEARTAL